jgi:hypothetical protein
VIGMKQEENAMITFQEKKVEKFLYTLIYVPPLFLMCIVWFLCFTEIVEEYRVYMKILFGAFTVLLLTFYGILLWIFRKYYSTKKLWGNMGISLILLLTHYTFIVSHIF